MQHCRWGLTEQSRNHLPRPLAFFWCIPEDGWLSGLQVHIARSCLIFHLPIFPSPSSEAWSQSIHPPVCINTGDCPDPDTKPSLDLTELHQGIWGHQTRDCDKSDTSHFKISGWMSHMHIGKKGISLVSAEEQQLDWKYKALLTACFKVSSG